MILDTLIKSLIKLHQVCIIMIVLSHKMAWINLNSRPWIIVGLLQSHLLCLGLMINLIMDSQLQ